jgi:hypothetical protein
LREKKSKKTVDEYWMGEEERERERERGGEKGAGRLGWG